MLYLVAVLLIVGGFFGLILGQGKNAGYILLGGFVTFGLGILQYNIEKKNDTVNSKNSPTSTYSESYESGESGHLECEWCGKTFDEGGGYNTLMREIHSPANKYSSYCSKKCATEFLRNN